MGEQISLSQSIIKLRIKTRLATMRYGNNLISLKTKLLFLIKDTPLPPQDIISELCIQKTNLAILCNNMCEEGLVVKKPRNDKRQILIEITDEGRQLLTAAENKIEEGCKKAFTQDEYFSALAALEKASNILDFII